MSALVPRTAQLLLIACVVLTLACASKNPTSPSRPAADIPFAGEYPIHATVTVGMVADLVRSIGGEYVQVRQLMGAAVDPHLHTATRDDAAAIASADIVFYSGLLLEGKMSEMLKRIGDTTRSFAAAESLAPELLGHDPSEHAHPDPHVWMHVDLWSQVAGAIGAELSSFDPTHASQYAQATQQIRDQLARLHQYGIEVMADIPEQQRVLVTSHDAFRYFGQAYQVEVEAIQGISTESEAGLNRINGLVDLLVRRRIGSVFIESSVPQESIEALLRGAGSKGHSVKIAGTLYSDAMGTEGTYEGTYIGMMDHNLSTIARALGSSRVPEDGFRGSVTRKDGP